MLQSVADVERIHGGQYGDDVEDQAEDEAQPIDTDDRQGVIEELQFDREITPAEERREVREAQQRQRDDVYRLHLSAEQRHEQRAEQQDRRRGKAIDHSSLPVA